MAKNKKEAPLNTLSVDELDKKLEKSQEEIFKLRFRAATAPLKNTMAIRQNRKEIARLKTFINQRKKSA